MPSGEALVEFRGVSKTYSDPWSRGVVAVRDASIRIGVGEVFGLLGPNRAGKTTLVKMLLSLCRPTSGEIQRLGRPYSDRQTLAQVGYVHENHAFPKYPTARNLLEFYGALSFVPEDVLKPRISALLERVGLADRGDEPIARFSKGMVQRLGIAQALINEPRLLVLDEPTEGLDLSGRVMLREVVSEVVRRGGGVLLVSHVLSEIQQLCTRVAVLVRGQVVHQGTLADLLAADKGREPRSLETALTHLYQQDRKSDA